MSWSRISSGDYLNSPRGDYFEIWSRQAQRQNLTLYLSVWLRSLSVHLSVKPDPGSWSWLTRKTQLVKVLIEL